MLIDLLRKAHPPETIAPWFSKIDGVAKNLYGKLALVQQVFVSELDQVRLDQAIDYALKMEFERMEEEGL